MPKEVNEASRWRIELAGELAQPYVQHPGIRMIVLGGSPTRGLSDAYSDLDIVVYWDEIDLAWIEAEPLATIGVKRKHFRKMGVNGPFLEHYYLGNLKADFGHVTLNEWQEMTDKVMKEFSTEAGLQKTIAGFLEAIPLHGHELHETWKQRLIHYPEEVGQKMMKENLGLFVRGCLLHQGADRDDLLFYYDGTCLILKKLLAILAGLNRVYFSIQEPRWIEFELERMTMKPENTWNRMKTILEGDKKVAQDMLDDLIDDVLDLMGKHNPQIDVSRIKKGIDTLAVLPCPDKPKIG